MITHKCMIAKCKKLNGQLFILKQLSDSLKELATNFIYDPKDRNCRPRMNLDIKIDYAKLVEKWYKVFP